MPIAASSTPNQNPVKTVEVSTEVTRNSGRAIGTVGSFGSEASAESAAPEAPPAPEAPATSQEGEAGHQEAPQDQTKAEVEPSKAEARRMFLQAQKAERRAQEMLKKAEADAKKADEFRAALANRETDPLSVYRALGLDPQQEYQALTKEALKNVQEPTDPIQDAIKAQKEELARVAEQLKKQQEDLEMKELKQQEYAVLSQQVYPVLAKNADTFESVIAHCDGNMSKAADYVYETLKNIHAEQGDEAIAQLAEQAQKNGSNLFEQVALGLEEYHSKLIESGITKALQLKKFQKYGQSLTPTSQTSDRPTDQNDRPLARSKTLTNQVPATTITPSQPVAKSSNPDDVIRAHKERVLAKYRNK